MNGHTMGVNSVAFSPDGGRAVSGGFDSTVRLWQLPEPGAAGDKPPKTAEASTRGPAESSVPATAAGKPQSPPAAVEAAVSAPNPAYQGSASLRMLTLGTGIRALATDNGEMPRGSFWPPLVPDASESWRFGDSAGLPGTARAWRSVREWEAMPW